MGNSFSSDDVPDVFDINNPREFPYLTYGMVIKRPKHMLKCYACALLGQKCKHDLVDDAHFQEFLKLVIAIKNGDRSLHILFYVAVLAVRCVQMGMIIPGSFIRLPCSTFGRDWLSWWEKNYPSQFPSCLARMLNVFFRDLEWIRGLAPRRASVVFLGLCKNRTITMGGYPLPREISLNIAGMVCRGWSHRDVSKYPSEYLFEELVKRGSHINN